VLLLLYLSNSLSTFTFNEISKSGRTFI